MKGLSFSTDLVPKVLDGSKTVTRRPIKPQPPSSCNVPIFDFTGYGSFYDNPDKDGDCDDVFPKDDGIQSKYKPGEIVYIQEQGDYAFSPKEKKPKLRIVSVRVERLWDITHEDAESEGLELWAWNKSFELRDKRLSLAQLAFSYFWDSIYSKTFPWNSNPWVWRYEFERVSE